MLDPGLFIVSESEDPTEAIEGLLCIVDWCSSVERGICNVVGSVAVESALAQEGLYPHPHVVHHLVGVAAPQVADAETIVRALDSLLYSCPKVEDKAGIEEVLLDEDETEIDPDWIVGCLPNGVASALEEALATCLLGESISACELLTMFAVSPSRGDGTCDSLSASFSVEMIHPMPEGMATPTRVAARKPLVRWPSEVLCALDIADVIECPTLAVEWCWLKSLEPSDRQRHPLRPYVFKPTFVSSKGRHYLDRNMNEQLYRKIAMLLSGLNLVGLDIHPVRVSRGGGSAQKKRSFDGAKACRLQVSQYGAGYQVQYWDRLDGMIELAYFGKESDVSIPE